MRGHAGHGKNQKDRRVHNQLRDRVQQDRNLCDPHGGGRELVQLAAEAGVFLPRFAKGTNHADAGHIFADDAGHPVEVGLNAFIQRHAFFHNQRHRKNEKRDDGDDNQRQPPIEDERHNYPADAQKRRADDQPDEHSDHKLKLVDVVGQPIDERRRAEAVGIAVREGHDFAEQLIAQRGAEALRSLAGQILANQRHPQPGGNDAHEHERHPADVGVIPRCDAAVDDLREQKRHIKLQHRLRQLKQRTDDALHPIRFQIAK